MPAKIAKIAPGTIFAIFAGIYYWFPKVTGRRMNEGLGKLHFVTSFITINGVFMPMLIVGVAGMLRRGYDPTAYAANEHLMGMVRMTSWSAWALGLSQLSFIFNFFLSIVAGKKVSNNPWDATTLEWSAPSPPPHGNFETVPAVYRGPYEYNTHDRKDDFFPQNMQAEA